MHDPVAFIDEHILLSELGRPFQLADHQRAILRLAFAFDDAGRLPWDTIIYSCPKKSGKTTINAAVALWWALCVESPNEIPVVANDLEQAQSRVFKAVAGLLKHNPHISVSAEVQASRILFANGTEIRAIASDYRGEAGGNHGLTSWDELWAYSTESSTRLWEELTPVPTRLNSIRFVSTYAGWENESKLLWDLYLKGIGPEEHRDGQGVKLHSDLPIYANHAARLFVYWDHEPRMPWQTPAYYAGQRKSLRPNTYVRLHENRWAVAEAIFITPEGMFDPCVDPALAPLLPSQDHALYVGVDAGIKHDSASVVAVYREENRILLATHRIWKPSPQHPLDIEGTIEAYLRELWRHYFVEKILCDPYQLHRTITTLKQAGLPIEEYPQTVPNLTRLGQGLYDLFTGKNLRLYPAPDIRDHALNTVAIESARGWRIAKEKSTKKIDSIVALGMACVAALDRPPEPRLRRAGAAHGGYGHDGDPCTLCEREKAAGGQEPQQEEQPSEAELYEAMVRSGLIRIFEL